MLITKLTMFHIVVNISIPVKNVTWTLSEIPSHFMSQIDGSLAQIPTKFHDYSMSQIDGSLVQIPTKFHDYSMSFIQVLFVFNRKTGHGFWISSSHGISMIFTKNMMGFPSDSFSFSTKLPS